jgi:hypothetical protein
MPQDSESDPGTPVEPLGRRSNQIRGMSPTRGLRGSPQSVEPRPTLSATCQVDARTLELAETRPTVHQTPQLAVPKVSLANLRLDLPRERIEKPLLKALGHRRHLPG